ncbi:hypothetical protein T01_7396 [Trichinella spiralis]|uniref:Uncharacterized protein n=1 Tax=Trichinella spiralis TaxID=6334 RepID=A0A0V1BKF5_TRISP|nr:hypothetical protein T01_7396 [Trichinella spiralis]
MWLLYTVHRYHPIDLRARHSLMVRWSTGLKPPRNELLIYRSVVEIVITLQKGRKPGDCQQDNRRIKLQLTHPVAPGSHHLIPEGKETCKISPLWMTGKTYNLPSPGREVKH